MEQAHSELLGRVVEICAKSLSNPALERLVRAGVADLALLERFQVGCLDGTLAALARGKTVEDLKRLGLLDEAGRERWTGRIVIPVFDFDGRVVQLAAYGEGSEPEWLLPETAAWWNGRAMAGAREVAVVPDPLRGLALLARGEGAVIAPGGPGRPLGASAREAILAHGPRIRLEGAEFLRAELLSLGLEGVGKSSSSGVEPIDGGFAVEFPGRIRFVVQGISQETPRHLRASVRVCRREAEGSPPGREHLDTFDLYHARSRIGFAKTAACLLGEDPLVLEDLVSRVVGLAEDFLRKRGEAAPSVAVGEVDRQEALALLRDPHFPERVAEDLGRLGYVGEDANKQVAYLAALSRKLEDPLSILVVSRSAAGKSTLSEAVSALAPPEDVLRFTRLTAQTLYYQKPRSLEHKLVVIEEEKGVEDAAYALRVLQSARKLSLSSASGKGDARTREVKGPVSLFVTTTRTDLDEETAGRFLTLAVDESPEQTRAILAAQRAAEAQAPAERERLLELHRNAQRLLAPVAIVNPYATRLTFPDDRLSARRDHRKYLGLIRAVAFARQHQRPIDVGSIRVTPDDISLANRLAHHALGQSVYDLTPPSRRLLVEIKDWLSGKEGEPRFSQRELRERVAWKKTQVAEHVRELVEAEYLVVHVQGPGRRTRYALDWNGEGLDGEKFYRGLLDVATLEASGSVPDHFRASSGSRKAALSRGKTAPSDRSSGEKGS